MNGARPSRKEAALPAPFHTLKKLTSEQILRIDEILAAVGEYGEVHLIVQHGEVRYINKVESYKAWTGDRAGG